MASTKPKVYAYGTLKRPIVVQRIEQGSRTEYWFKTLDDALEFIRRSKRYTGFEIYKHVGGL